MGSFSHMLAIYSIAPIPPRSGSKWEDSQFYGEVLVRAESDIDARLLAAEMPVSGSPDFFDETLYRVREVNYGEAFLAAGPRGVIVRLADLTD